MNSLKKIITGTAVALMIGGTMVATPAAAWGYRHDNGARRLPARLWAVWRLGRPSEPLRASLAMTMATAPARSMASLTATLRLPLMDTTTTNNATH
jgi:hypothetical protein